MTRTRLQCDSSRRCQGNSMDSAGAGAAANGVNEDDQRIRRKASNKCWGAGLDVADLASVPGRATKLGGNFKTGCLVGSEAASAANHDDTVRHRVHLRVSLSQRQREPG